MPYKIIEKFLKVKTSTIDNMKFLLEEVKNCKNEKLEQEIIKLQKELKEVKKLKKYGLVWEEKIEKFDEETVGKLPVLEEIKKYDIKNDESQANILIEGDNYHTLSVLNYTHKGKIDIIYIDPPYNTGKQDFTYNDKIIDKDDNFRHSKWLSFMNKRLKLAKDLLSEKGVIFISIDDNELATLKLLCDKHFGIENFISILSVENNPKGRKNSKFISKSNEFLLIYVKNNKDNKSYFKENIQKEGKILIDENGKKYSHGKRVLVGESSNNVLSDFKSNKNYFVYFNKKSNQIIIEREKNIENINLNLIKKGIILYKSIKDNKLIENTYSEEKFLELFYSNSLIFKKDSIYEKDFNLFTRMKSFLKNTDKLDLKTETSTKILKNLGIEFSNPKNINYIKLLFGLLENKNSTILDFFAGSGTTGHAVLELNKEDGGERKFILATNNENKICEEVTYERVKRVMNGYKNLKGENVEGLGGNLKYLRTDFIDKNNSNDDLRMRMVDRCSELLCLKENIWDEKTLPLVLKGAGGIIDNKIKIFERKDKYLAILYDMFYIGDFIEMLNKIGGNKEIVIYTFSHYKIDNEDFEELNVNFTIEEIPDPILEVYENILGL